MGKDAKLKAERRRGKVHLAVISDVVQLYRKELLPRLDDVVAVQNDETSRHGTRPISCKRGCVGCCNQLVLVDFIEAFAIADYILRNALASPALLETMLAHSKRQSVATREEWFRSATPCAFLDPKTKDCMVYDVRPTACRNYYVISPAENCFPGSTDQNVKSVNMLPSIIVHRKATGQLLAAAHKKVPQIPAVHAMGALPIMATIALSAITSGMDRFMDMIDRKKLSSIMADEEKPIVGESPGEREYCGYIIARAGLDPEQFGLPRPPENTSGGDGDVHATDQAAGAAGTVPGGVPEPPAT